MSIVSLGADAIIVSTTRFLLTRYGQPLCFPELVNKFSWCAWILHSHMGIGNGWSQAMLLLPSLQPTPAKCQSRATMLGLSVTPRRWWVGLNCSRGIPYLKSSRKVYRFSHCAQDKYKVNSPMAGCWFFQTAQRGWGAHSYWGNRHVPHRNLSQVIWMCPATFLP